ncbi:MAG: PqiC family protein [Pseudomonadota bacterium]|nr:PqiC family protein [Pseudomonadota bacterium]
MSPPRRKLLLMALALPAVLATPACTSLVSRPAPVKEMFLLDPPLPEKGGAPAKPAVLRIGTVNVAAPYRAKNFVYRRSDLGYEADYYHEFFVPPALMLADAMAKGLAAAGIFERVVPAGVAGNEGDFLLDAFVAELYGDGRAQTRGAAVLRVTFYLSALSAPGAAPVWTREYSQRAEFDGTGAQGLAQGLSRALGQVLSDLARDLAREELKTSPQ